jgi:glyoxylase-like metal-dependent hydrolase (beta-lactamase superfamily II)
MMFFESQVSVVPGVRLPVRSTLIQLSSGAVLISPIDFSDRQIQSIRDLTPVTDIVAPNLFHHKWLQRAQIKFPGSKFWGPPGLKEKFPDVPLTKTLTEDVWPYKDELELVFLKGAAQANECVFFHKSSKTLIVTDLCFNLQAPKGFLAPIVLRLMRTYKRFAVSTLWNRMVTDKALFYESLKKLLALDFETIVMSHGDILRSTAEASAKQRLEASLSERGLLSPQNSGQPLLQAPKTPSNPS